MAVDLSFLGYNPFIANAANPVSLSIPGEAERQWLLGVPRDKVLCLDLETTGLKPHGNDEILQVSICDGNGDTVLSTYVKPAHRRTWKDAEKIHGITPAMVKGAPKMDDLNLQIFQLIKDCELLIGYNIRGYDLEFLKAADVVVPHTTRVYDVMLDCSVLYGEWSGHYRNYKFVGLKAMAGRLGIAYVAHDALEDAVTTTKVFYALLDSAKLKNALRKADGAVDARAEAVLTDAQYQRIGCMVFILGFALLSILMFAVF